MTDALEVIAHRRSIRCYTPQPVDRETIIKLLKAAMAAPSAGNRQPWEFIVITERATLDKLAESHPFAKMLYQAPLCVSVCGAITRGYEGTPEYWVQDCSAATENLLLAAEALGLGAVWCGVYPRQERVDAVQKLLGLPPKVIPLNIIAVGHPGEDPKPKDKWREERIHWEKW